MLIGPDWAFAHIPKCGGTALRAVLEGEEVGIQIPLKDRCPIRSHLHSMLIKPPPGRRTFTVIRHPAAWIRSFWRDQSPQRMGGGRYLHRFWAPDLNIFARRLCNGHPGYVGDLYNAYTHRFPMQIYKLENGLEAVMLAEFGMQVTIPVVNVSQSAGDFDPETLDLIVRTESVCMNKYEYS